MSTETGKVRDNLNDTLLRPGRDYIMQEDYVYQRGELRNIGDKMKKEIQERIA